LFPSSLHGYKFLRLEPKITLALFHFLETCLKNRPLEWEPEYNLTPVKFDDPQIVMNTTTADPRKDQRKAEAKDAIRPVQDQGAAKAQAMEAQGNKPRSAAKEAVPPPPQPEKQH
jgi:hypothetical protein